MSEHGVDVAEVTERWTALLARHLRDQVRTVRDRSDQLALESRLLQVCAQVLLCFEFVAWGIDGVELDQPLQQRDSFFSQRRF
jgi:hypothetical protein